MATIKRRSDRGNRWEVRYRDPEGKQRARLFDRKVEAERFAATTTVAVLEGTYVAPSAGRVTVREYGERWRAMQVHRATTAAQLETNLRRHVYPTLGDRYLSGVRPSEVQAWVKGRVAVLAPATVEVVYRYLAAIFAAAVEDRLIPVTPCKGIRLPKVEAAQVVPLATEAVEALIDAVPDRYRALVVLAAGTGLRQGEAFGVSTSRLDFLRRTLTVDRQLVLLPGQPPYLAPPKTAASRRTVPLPDVVLGALAGHLAAFPAGEGDALVFTAPDGGGIRRNRFSDGVWVQAVERCGLPKGTGFHALRHYYASLLIRHGESVKVVQARLGHASATETLDTYSHLWPDSEDRTRLAVDSVRGRSAPHVHQTGTADA